MRVDTERPAFLPAIDPEGRCSDCGARKLGSSDFKPVETDRGIVVVCASCAYLRRRFGRDPFS